MFKFNLKFKVFKYEFKLKKFKYECLKISCKDRT